MNCGHLHRGEYAGDNTVPHACCVCGCGVKFNAKGAKELDPKNWEVLADASSSRLKELGLTAKDVEKYVPKSVPLKPNPEHTKASIGDAPVTKDDY
jgi:hypothetical protein